MARGIIWIARPALAPLNRGSLDSAHIHARAGGGGDRDKFTVGYQHCVSPASAKNYSSLRHSHFCRTHIMNIMGRHVLRLMEIGAVAIAIPQLASAFDSENGAAFKLAM